MNLEEHWEYVGDDKKGNAMFRRTHNVDGKPNKWWLERNKDINWIVDQQISKLKSVGYGNTRLGRSA